MQFITLKRKDCAQKDAQQEIMRLCTKSTWSSLNSHDRLSLQRSLDGSICLLSCRALRPLSCASSLLMHIPCCLWGTQLSCSPLKWFSLGSSSAQLIISCWASKGLTPIMIGWFPQLWSCYDIASCSNRQWHSDTLLLVGRHKNTFVPNFCFFLFWVK